MTRERVVIDTNVLISSLFLTTSTPAQAVDKAVTNAQLTATTETLRELIGKLHSPKFDLRRNDFHLCGLVVCMVNFTDYT